MALCRLSAFAAPIIALATAQSSTVSCPPAIAESLPTIVEHELFGDCSSDGTGKIEFRAEADGVGFKGVFAGACNPDDAVHLELQQFPRDGLFQDCAQDSDCPYYACPADAPACDFEGCAPKCVDGQCQPDFEGGMSIYDQYGGGTEAYCFRFESIPIQPETFMDACFPAANPNEDSSGVGDDSSDEDPEGPHCPEAIYGHLSQSMWHEFSDNDCTSAGTGGEVKFDADNGNMVFHGIFEGACDPQAEEVFVDIYYTQKQGFWNSCTKDDDCLLAPCSSAVCVDGMCQPNWEAGMQAHEETGADTWNFCFGYNRFPMRPEDLLDACSQAAPVVSEAGDSPCDRESQPRWDEANCTVFEEQDELGFPEHPSDWEREASGDCLDIYDEYLSCLWKTHPDDQSVGWRSTSLRQHLVKLSGRAPVCISVPKYLAEKVKPVPCHES